MWRMKPMRAWPPLLATERRSERDTRERVQCVWVRMGPVRAWLRWARGGVRGGEGARRRGGEEARTDWTVLAHFFNSIVSEIVFSK